MAERVHDRLPSRLTCLIWAFQSLGLLCFKKPFSLGASGRAELSLPLLLWTVFVKMFQITLTVSMILRNTFNLHDVGWLTSYMSIVISAASLIVGQIALIINGPILRQILSECEEDARPRVDSGGAFMKNLVSVFFFCSNTTMVIMLVSTFHTDSDGANIITYHVHAGITIIGMMVTVMMFREVVMSATKKLNVDFLTVDGSSSDSETIDPRLNMLEGIIQEVSSVL